jgi:hypothetical protein
VALRSPTEREVRFARAFIHALHANEANGYLLLAVIGWIRGLDSNWTGSNPLNLTTRAGKRLFFRSYLDAAKATANRLLNNQKDSPGWHGFGLIVKAATRTATSDAQRVTQARDFLQALALSSWDAHHFGMLNVGPHGSYVVDRDSPEKNKLVALWAGLTGFHIPAKWFVDGVKVQPPPRPKFQQTSSTENHFPKGEYIRPYGPETSTRSARTSATTSSTPTDTLVPCLLTTTFSRPRALAAGSTSRAAWTGWRRGRIASRRRSAT